MAKARWLATGALTLTLVASACSSDGGASAPGNGASGDAGAAGEPASNGGGNTAGHGNAEAGSAGAAPDEAAGASGTAGASEAEAGAAGAPISAGGHSNGGAGAGGTSGSSGTSGTSGTSGNGGSPVVTCLPAGELDVTASASLTYMIDTQTDPTLVLCRGSKYTFNLDVTGHPFYIKTVDNSTGTGDAFSEGVVGNGNTTGTLVFTVPADAPAALYYHCAYHLGMGGKLTIID